MHFPRQENNIIYTDLLHSKNLYHHPHSTTTYFIELMEVLMPRKARIISSTGIYHIILRSVNQHIIFEEDSDYQKFLYIMTDCKKKYDIDIYAYCLMDNHVHLIVNAKPDMMSSFFKSFGARFVRWYNIKYSRCGHLFQDRYHSRIIETTEYFLKTLIYIHDNPVKANI